MRVFQVNNLFFLIFLLDLFLIELLIVLHHPSYNVELFTARLECHGNVFTDVQGDGSMTFRDEAINWFTLPCFLEILVDCFLAQAPKEEILIGDGQEEIQQKDWDLDCLQLHFHVPDYKNILLIVIGLNTFMALLYQTRKETAFILIASRSNTTSKNSVIYGKQI